MADILPFRTKRLTGFIPEAEAEKPEQDTAPCETPPYQASEDGDCA